MEFLCKLHQPLESPPENHNTLLLPVESFTSSQFLAKPVETEVDFDRLLTYKIEYSDAIVNFEDSQEEYLDAYSHFNKINSIVKIEDNSIESFKNSLNLAKDDYDNKLNNLYNAKNWLNNLENKIFEMENRILSANIRSTIG